MRQLRTPSLVFSFLRKDQHQFAGLYQHYVFRFFSRHVLIVFLCLSTFYTHAQPQEWYFLNHDNFPRRNSPPEQPLDNQVVFLPTGYANILYCISFDVINLPAGTNLDWVIEFMEGTEFATYHPLSDLALFNPPLPAYRVPSDADLSYDPNLRKLHISFTPPVQLPTQPPPVFAFTFKLTDPISSTVYFHQDLFIIETRSSGQFDIVELSIDGSQLPNNHLRLNPDSSAINLAIKAINSPGELKWSVPYRTGKNRLVNAEQISSVFSPDTIIYQWRIAIEDILRPNQLGGVDTLSFIPFNCQVPPNTFSPDTTLYLHIPDAKVVLQKDYVDNILPSGSVDLNYAEAEVVAQLQPKEVDYSAYDGWSLRADDQIMPNGTFPVFAETSPPDATGLSKLLAGTPEYGVENQVVRIQVGNDRAPFSTMPIVSDDYYLTICDDGFAEVPKEYEVVLLPDMVSFGNQEGEAIAISNSGYIIGKLINYNQEEEAVIWFQNSQGAWQVRHLISPSEDATVVAMDVNDRGDVVGYIESSIPDKEKRLYSGICWTIQSRDQWEVQQTRTIPWIGGSPPILSPIMTEIGFQFKSINNNREIVGTYHTREEYEFDIRFPFPNTIVVPYIDKEVLQFPFVGGDAKPLSSDLFSEVAAINDQGQFTGSLWEKTERPTAPFTPVSPTQVFTATILDDDISLKKIGAAMGLAQGNAINNQGRICGSARGNTYQAKFWRSTVNGWEAIDLHLPPFASSTAQGINDLDQVVGFQSGTEGTKAFIFDDRLYQLNKNVTTGGQSWSYLLDDLSSESSNIQLSKANDINNAGWIVGQGILPTGAKVAVLIRPKRDYYFRTFRDVPLALNNRGQVILSDRSTGNSRIWERCLEDITMDGEHLRIADLNDNMLAIGNLPPTEQQAGLWKRMAVEGKEQWQFGTLSLDFNPSLQPNAGSVVKVRGVSNANHIVGSATVRELTSSYNSGISWWWDGNDLVAPEEAHYTRRISLFRPMQDLNSSNISTTSTRYQIRGGPTTNSFITPPGLYDLGGNQFYQLGTGKPGTKNEDLRSVNSAGKTVGVSNNQCPLQLPASRGIIAAQPYRENYYRREFCDFEATGINSQGWVVGNKNGRAVAFIPDHAQSLNGGMVDLNDFLSPADRAHWQLSRATAINDAGEVSGVAILVNDEMTNDPETYGFMLQIRR